MSRGRVWERGGVWWIQYSVGGRQYRESARTHRKGDADALLRERLQAVWEGRFFPGKKNAPILTLGQLKKLWLDEKAKKRSLGDDEGRLGAIVDHWGEHRLVATITPDDVSALRNDLRARPLTDATVNRYLAVLRAALNLAAKRGHQHRNPMAGVALEPERNRRNRLCTADEYAKLIEHAPEDLGVAVAIGYWLGWRLGEIVGLTWDRVDLKTSMVRLAAEHTKEGDIKAAPLPTDAVGRLEVLPRNISGRVFRFNRDWYSRAFSELAQTHAPGMTFHDLRHTALTNMRRRGLDLVTMAAFSGHKTLSVLRRYQHVSEDDLKIALAKVEGHAATVGKDRK